ncbi:thioredoxin [Streptomyces sp. NPDC006645]|uniref:thioredoxin n=1 Tax=unclassified Streptomyces TaxID=2593676 RepID=UPI0033A9B5ED
MTANRNETSGITVCETCHHTNRVPPAAEGRPRCGNCGVALPWIVDAGDADFGEIAENATPLVLIDLWATWCGPCRLVSPALEQVARELAGQVKLVKVDVDQAPRTAQRFQVRAVPTLILLDHREELDRRSGAAPASVLREWVENTLARQEAPA